MSAATELPTGWVTCSLGEVVDISTGKLDANAATEGGEFPFFTCADEVARIDTFAFDTEAILLAGNGTFRAKYFCGKFNAYQRTYVLQPRKHVDPKFVFNCVEHGIPRISANNRGSTIRYLRLGDIATCAIQLPPLNEQKRIVAKLESLQGRSRRARAALDAAAPLLEKLRQSILAAAFRGDLTADWRAKQAADRAAAKAAGKTALNALAPAETAAELLQRIRTERRAKWEAAELAKLTARGKAPKDDAWKSKYAEPKGAIPEFGVPDSWQVVRAEEVCGFITKGTTPSSSKMNAANADVPFLKVYNLTLTGELDFSIDPTFVSTDVHEGELARSRVLPGDVLMNIVGPPLGKVSLVPSDYREWNINQAIAVFRPEHGLCAEYLCYALLDPETIGRSVMKAKATAGQSNLTLEICRDLQLPLPPMAEQQEIVSRVKLALTSARGLATSMESLDTRLDDLANSILAAAFRGELVPQDPNDEPAAVMLARLRSAAASDDGDTSSKPSKVAKPTTKGAKRNAKAAK